MSAIAKIASRATEPETRASPKLVPAPQPSRPETLEASPGADVSIHGLDKRFGDKIVLDQLDLTIPAGQFVAIVGRSGCGKSTLLRLLVGLDQPTSGSIKVTGPAVAADQKAEAAQARIVFQEPRLLPWANIEDNVAVGLGEGRKTDERRAKVVNALAEVGLKDRAKEWPSVLSGGQKQRVALARALVSHPQLLVLDEPLGALDALTRITMQGLIERVWFAQGMTAVLVTHDVSEAVALADRVIVLDAGRVMLDVEVKAARPRERGSAELAALEGRLLDAIFGVADVVY